MLALTTFYERRIVDVNLCQMPNINRIVGGMPWPETGTTHRDSLVGCLLGH